MAYEKIHPFRVPNVCGKVSRVISPSVTSGVSRGSTVADIPSCWTETQCCTENQSSPAPGYMSFDGSTTPFWISYWNCGWLIAKGKAKYTASSCGLPACRCLRSIQLSGVVEQPDLAHNLGCVQVGAFQARKLTIWRALGGDKRPARLHVRRSSNLASADLDRSRRVLPESIRTARVHHLAPQLLVVDTLHRSVDGSNSIR